MTSSRRTRRGWSGLAGIALLGLAGMVGYQLTSAADHTDGPMPTGDQAADLADIYSFVRGDNMVLAMTISNVQAAPEIVLGKSIFDPEVLYQFKIDNDGDAVEDIVIQSFVTGPPADQTMHFVGPLAPDITGTSARIERAPGLSVPVSTGQTPIIVSKGDATVFAGVRDDPFFFDLTRFLAVLGGQAGSFRDPGIDTFAGLNVFAIVVEIPLAVLGADPSAVSVWGTTHRL